MTLYAISKKVNKLNRNAINRVISAGTTVGDQGLTEEIACSKGEIK